MARIICVKPCVAPVNLTSIALPFMGEMVSTPPVSLSVDCSGCEQVSSLLTAIQPAMGGMGIPIKILGCVGAIIKFATSVKDALGPPPDPSLIAVALADIAIKCEFIVLIAVPGGEMLCGFLKMVRDSVAMINNLVGCLISLIDDAVKMAKNGEILSLSDVGEVAAMGDCLTIQSQRITAHISLKASAMSALMLMIRPILDILAIIPGFSAAIAPMLSALAVFDTATNPPPDAEPMLAALTTLKSALLPVVAALNILAGPCP